MVGVSAENRAGAKVAGGDVIDVDIELDTAPRVVTVPKDFAAALKKDAKAKKTFDALSNSNKGWHVSSIEGAKTDETRQRRIAKSVAALREGQARADRGSPATLLRHGRGRDVGAGRPRAGAPQDRGAALGARAARLGGAFRAGAAARRDHRHDAPADVRDGRGHPGIDAADEGSRAVRAVREDHGQVRLRGSQRDRHAGRMVRQVHRRRLPRVLDRAGRRRRRSISGGSSRRPATSRTRPTS